jgi:hypothetical protein
MNPWGIFEFIYDLFLDYQFFRSWRTFLCLICGITLASAATLLITVEPLRWIVAGAIIVASIWIALRWEEGH